MGFWFSANVRKLEKATGAKAVVTSEERPRFDDDGNWLPGPYVSESVRVGNFTGLTFDGGATMEWHSSYDCGLYDKMRRKLRKVGVEPDILD